MKYKNDFLNKKKFINFILLIYISKKIIVIKMRFFIYLLKKDKK